MQPVHSQVPGDLKYLALLARDYPTQAAASSEVIKLQALMKLPKGTEHFVSDLKPLCTSSIPRPALSGKRWTPCWATARPRRPAPSWPP